MVISLAGLNLIKSFESCRQTAYQDAGGVWTVGYGHTGKDIGPGTFWTQQQCDTALAHDVEGTETVVTQLLGESVKNTSQEQFDALTCFAYNVGTEALKDSTLLRLYLAGDHYGAALQFPLWVHDGNQVLPGLVKRRIVEANLFLEGTR